MTQKCVDYFRKWKKEPNFCGLGKTTANKVDKYLEFVEEFSEEYKFDEELIYRNVPQSSITPIMRFKKDSDIRSKVKKQIAQTLRDKHAVSLKYVNFLVGIDPTTKPLNQNPIIQSTSEIPKETFAKNNVKEKLRVISSVLTPGQMGILSDVAKKKDLDDEYAALALVLIWAKERIKNE
jgi:hypothetical protein